MCVEGVSFGGLVEVCETITDIWAFESSSSCVEDCPFYFAGAHSTLICLISATFETPKFLVNTCTLRTTSSTTRTLSGISSTYSCAASMIAITLNPSQFWGSEHVTCKVCILSFLLNNKEGGCHPHSIYFRRYFCHTTLTRNVHRPI